MMSIPRAASGDDSERAGIDPAPLLGDQIFRNRQYLRRTQSLRGAARFLRRASSRRMLREPSMRVREAAAEQIEERQSDWAYSKPIVVLDLIWNVAFVAVSFSVLVLSRQEKPSMPLRLWVVGYALQCLLHMVCVVMEYRRRCRLRQLAGEARWSGGGSSNGGGGGRWSSGSSSSGSDNGEIPDYSSSRRMNDDETSVDCLPSRIGEFHAHRVAKHLESANTMFSFIWWIIGFYWVSAGGPNLTDDAPQLYWLCITFLAFDVFFVVICVAVASVIGIAVCCCLPCIIAILYAVADQEGATKEDIERLPKFKFRRYSDSEKGNTEIQESFGGIMTECDTDAPVEHVLPLEDAECCICLCTYDDGTELRELPCRHHFHSVCIDKWLYINATCPLCKLNILKIGNQSGSEEA